MATQESSRRGRVLCGLAVGIGCLLLRTGALHATGFDVGNTHAAAQAAAVPGGPVPPTVTTLTTVATIAAAPVTTVPPPPPTVPPTTAPPWAPPTSPEQWFQPAGYNQGTENIANQLANIALRDNSPLYVSDTFGRTTGAATSDHYYKRTDSWAIDVAVRGIQQPTPATYEAARRISMALGVPNWNGGDLIKTINGYRIQVLWLVEGHFNHVHIGVRKVG